MPRSPTTPHPLARAAVALDPGRVVRPRTIADPDQPDAVRAWEALLDAGLIGPATRPPVAPEVIASRDAADALFRRIAADRRRAGG
ncbi:MAG: hypothetical protein E7773_07635 [Sphingomonas sp.]|uniref:hypothetical protein n=1 Tax=Sphingomonas sp. TaxID=28214 RepID=UPI001229924B|nr:hypothetical protein [Sphingomonas sp.]THD36375.1 MAG: hypothetical protein E7773_07635 [Sphingomonas sp.]